MSSVGIPPVLISALLLLLVSAGLAHQPVMDMAPRWKGGYGFQLRGVHRYSNERLMGDDELPNPFDLDKEVSEVWLEGIYTITREFRLTLKVPYIDQERKVIRNGLAVNETGNGFGDVEMAVLLKRYGNEDDRTYNFALTPKIRVPTGNTNGAFQPADGSWDLGLSISASFETVSLYQFYDLYYWENTKGDDDIHQGNELGLDINIGIHPYHVNETNSGLFLMLDLAAHHQDRGTDSAGTTGGSRVSLGPVVVLYKDNIMFRAEYSIPVYEKVFGTQTSYGKRYNIGLGITF